MTLLKEEEAKARAEEKERKIGEVIRSHCVSTSNWLTPILEKGLQEKMSDSRRLQMCRLHLYIIFALFSGGSRPDVIETPLTCNYFLIFCM